MYDGLKGAVPLELAIESDEHEAPFPSKYHEIGVGSLSVALQVLRDREVRNATGWWNIVDEAVAWLVDQIAQEHCGLQRCLSIGSEGRIR